MNYFTNFKVSKPEFNLLSVGEHIVRLIRYEESNSFIDFGGKVKEKQFEWRDATPTLLITVVAAENGKSGGLTHAMNGMGYVRFDELSDKNKASGEYEDKGGYACTLNEEGQLVRIMCPERTKKAHNMLNQLASALGAETDESLQDVLERAVADQVKFKVTVVNDEYDGREQLRLTRFKAVTNVYAELE